jgi:hypothetical protein
VLDIQSQKKKTETGSLQALSKQHEGVGLTKVEWGVDNQECLLGNAYPKEES